MSIQQNIWQQFIAENIPLLEKLFVSNVWKRVLLPWLKAQREVKIRTVLQDKDPDARELARGAALVLEGIINLPGAIVAYKEEQKKATAEDAPQPGEATHYLDSIEFDE